MQKILSTLAIETSCDDTSIAIVTFDGKTFKTKKILAYSQIKDHQKYGGVVPEIASRLHSEKIIQVLKKIGFHQISKVNFISVTTHPGLPGSLVVGKSTAYTLGEYFKKEVIQVNHIHGHIFSLFLEKQNSKIKLPMMVLTASGGHNDLYLVQKSDGKEKETKNPNNFIINKIGYTLDDAAGECFDKVSRMLGGPYPGGEWISKKALLGKPNIKYQFKRIFLSSQNFEFSFSGMKSQVGFLLQKLKKEGIKLNEKIICDIAYEFQEAVIEVLAKKLIKSGIKYGALTLGIAGGVSANERLREYLNTQISKYPNIQVIRPNKKIYSTDNAAMIGVAGIIKYLSNKNYEN